MHKKSFFLAGSVLVLGMSMWSPAYAETVHEGDRCESKSSGARHKLLEQLPTEKEMLFHRTMREARAKMDGVREEIVKAREDARTVLLAPEFNEALFKEKTARVHALMEKEHQVMGDAIATLAKQYTPEERKLLADVLEKSTSRRGRGSHRDLM
jgi:uncharacterized membrane protein